MAITTPGVVPNPRQGGYLSKTCPERTAKDNMPLTYPPELKLPDSLFALSLMGGGNDFEEYIGQRLLADAVEKSAVVVIQEERDADGERTQEAKLAKEADTFAAYLDPAVRFIFNARIGGRFEELLSEHLGRSVGDALRISEPDAIDLGPMMPNGLRAMRFVDVKWHKVTDGGPKKDHYPTSTLAQPFFPGPRQQLREFAGQLQKGDWMQLAHYYRHAETLGLTDVEHSTWGAVLGKEEVLVWERLDSARYMQPDADGTRRKQTALELYDRKFAKGHAYVANARARDLDPSVPALTFPVWTSDCGECPWRNECRTQLENSGEGGHISLLAGVTQSHVQRLAEVGVRDVGQLARLSPTAAITGIGDTLPLIDQARAVLSGRVLFMRRAKDELPALPRLELPRADVEVDFDYEASTEEGGVYMRGVRITRRHLDPVSVEVITFDDYSGTGDGEARVFAQMWELFRAEDAAATAAGLSLAFYHYSHYERTQDKKLAKVHAGKPGIPSLAQVEDFYASGKVIDLYNVTKTLVWPAVSRSIKPLAKFAGFAWRGDQVGGDLSMVWYDQVCNGESEQVRAENLAQLREYNEDDTHAQWVLREWITAAYVAGEILPADLAPVPGVLAAAS